MDPPGAANIKPTIPNPDVTHDGASWYVSEPATGMIHTVGVTTVNKTDRIIKRRSCKVGYIPNTLAALYIKN